MITFGVTYLDFWYKLFTLQFEAIEKGVYKILLLSVIIILPILIAVAISDIIKVDRVLKDDLSYLSERFLKRGFDNMDRFVFASILLAVIPALGILAAITLVYQNIMLLLFKKLKKTFFYRRFNKLRELVGGAIIAFSLISAVTAIVVGIAILLNFVINYVLPSII